jgi:glycerol-3-phosphate acyltransferase PlsY
MLPEIYIITAFILAYLLGSIPTAVWYSKTFHGFDVREQGSGNAGATNTFRVLGAKAGAIVFVFDALKAYIATQLACVLLGLSVIEPGKEYAIFQLSLGMTAVMGHVFPCFAKFKGGKGVASLLGMVLAIHPSAALLCLGVFIVVFAITRYVSLGSIIAAIVYSSIMFTPWFKPEQQIIVFFAFAMSTLLILTHKKNIRRLIDGTENKIEFKGKKEE